MEQYNPKNPDAFKQVELPPEEFSAPKLNIIPIAKGQSVLQEGDFSSPNFKVGKSGFRFRSTGDFEYFSPPKMRISSIFETAARFNKATTGIGSNTFDTLGLTLDTGGAAGGSAVSRIILSGKSGGGTTAFFFSGDPEFSVHINVNFFNSVGSENDSSFFGIGSVTVTGNSHTYTDPHIGFKILNQGGVINVYATQADSVEKASPILTTLVADDEIELIFKVIGTERVDYYYRKNGGPLIFATSLALRLPISFASVLQYSISNGGQGDTFTLIATNTSYER